MRSLLDVNVLLALLDADHAFHQRAHAWWRRERPAWASCPLTENGFIRVMVSVNYSQTRKFTVGELAAQFRSFAESTAHSFWPDAISLGDHRHFCHAKILSSQQLTDVYLLGLAVENNGRLVTFDRHISLACVLNAKPHQLLVL